MVSKEGCARGEKGRDVRARMRSNGDGDGGAEADRTERGGGAT